MPNSYRDDLLAADTRSGNGDDLLRFPDPGPSRLIKVLLELWAERRFVAKAAAIGLLASTAIAFMLRPKYEATTRLVPPEKQTMQALAALPLLMGGAGDDKGVSGSANAFAGGLMTDMLGLKSSGALLIAVMRSRTVEDKIIDQFDLMKVYRHRYRKETREELEDHTDIVEDRKSSVIALTVEDKSPQRATAMARAYATNLNAMLAQLNTSAASRERAFIEERLKGVKHDLDDASAQLSQFSSKNTTFDVKDQARAMVESAARLQGELIAAEAYESSLEQVYTTNNVRVRAAHARTQELRKQLGQIRGSELPAGPAEGGSQDSLYPSLRQLPILGVTYLDLYRRTKIQEVLFETLSKQYEMAKIQEAKELPTVRVLDDAVVPERKARPHRLLMMLAGFLLGGIFGCVYIVGGRKWRSTPAEHPAKLLEMRVRVGLAEDVVFIRERLPKFHRNGSSRTEPKPPPKKDSEQ